MWGVEVVDATYGHERYLTASADLFIRLFEGEETKVVWSGHEDVVRDLRLLPTLGGHGAETLFASSS